jgi:hypothetical protein
LPGLNFEVHPIEDDLVSPWRVGKGDTLKSNVPEQSVMGNSLGASRVCRFEREKARSEGKISIFWIFLEISRKFHFFLNFNIFSRNFNIFWKFLFFENFLRISIFSLKNTLHSRARGPHADGLTKDQGELAKRLLNGLWSRQKGDQVTRGNLLCGNVSPANVKHSQNEA